MTYRKIKVRQLGGAGGAEITGVDLACADDEVIADIQRAIHQFLVVTLPDQPIDDAQFARFTSRLGPFGLEPFVEGDTTHPNVIAVIKEADEVRRMNFGGNWHSDWSFLETPPSYTLLHARELPPFGGDTLFANQYLAFESLSPGMKALTKGLQAVHSARRPYGPNSHNANGGHLRSMKIKTGPEAMAEFVHPIVRTHPATELAALGLASHQSRLDTIDLLSQRGGLFSPVFQSLLKIKDLGRFSRELLVKGGLLSSEPVVLCGEGFRLKGVLLELSLDAPLIAL